MKRIPLRAKGEKAFRHIRVVLIIGRVRQVFPYRAEPGCAFTEESMEKTIENTIEKLDKQYPRIDFRYTRVGRNQVTFVATGVRKNVEELSAQSDDRGREDVRADLPDLLHSGNGDSDGGDRTSTG